MALFKIAITGGIGSGKSTIARMLAAQANIPIVDADQIARDIIQPDTEALKQIIDVFGNHVLNEDGRLNRSALGSIIFNDVEQRIKLNNIMFPAITHEVVKQFVRYEANGEQYVIYDAPLLYHSGTDRLVNYIVCVMAPQKTIIERLQSRNGFTTEEIMARVSSQIPLVELLSYQHDYIVSNTLSFKKLKAIISTIWQDVQNKRNKPELYEN